MQDDDQTSLTGISGTTFGLVTIKSFLQNSVDTKISPRVTTPCLNEKDQHNNSTRKDSFQVFFKTFHTKLNNCVNFLLYGVK